MRQQLTSAQDEQNKAQAAQQEASLQLSVAQQKMEILTSSTQEQVDVLQSQLAAVEAKSKEFDLSPFDKKNKNTRDKLEQKRAVLQDYLDSHPTLSQNQRHSIQRKLEELRVQSIEAAKSAPSKLNTGRKPATTVKGGPVTSFGVGAQAVQAPTQNERILKIRSSAKVAALEILNKMIEYIKKYINEEKEMYKDNRASLDRIAQYGNIQLDIVKLKTYIEQTNITKDNSVLITYDKDINELQRRIDTLIHQYRISLGNPPSSAIKGNSVVFTPPNPITPAKPPAKSVAKTATKPASRFGGSKGDSSKRHTSSRLSHRTQKNKHRRPASVHKKHRTQKRKGNRKK